MKKLIFISLFLLFIQSVSSQTVEVKVVSRVKETAAVLKKARDETRANKLYYAEDEKCRQLIKARDFELAELSCKLAISYVDKLPNDQLLAKSSSRIALAVVMLWQRRPNEAILLTNKSIELAGSIIDDTDAEAGERYFLLGQAYHQLSNVEVAVKYYSKAEKTYRAAFKAMGDSEIRESYPRPIINILENHLFLLRNAGLANPAAIVEKR